VVRWIAQPVTATPGDDYRAITKPKTTKIAAGRTSALITLGVLPDTLDEDDEQIEVTLLEVVGGPAVLGPRSTGRGTIIDDDPGEPAVGVGDVAVVEGDEGSSTVSVPFTLSEPLTDAVKITWRVTPATASAGADYRDVAKPRTSRIDPGKTRALASLVVYGDSQYEGDEAAHVEVTDVTVIGGGATVGVSRPTGTLTILDDEPAPVIEPLHLGGVRNFLGTGDLAGILPPSVDTLANRPKSWLAISGQCSSKENGDRIMARTTQNYFQQTSNPRGVNSGSGSFRCTTSSIVQNNTEYDPRGYFYGIEVPVGYSGGPIAIEVYDAAACSSSSIDAPSVFRTIYVIRSNDSLNPTGASVLGTVPIAGGDSSGTCATPSTSTSGGYRGGWRQLYSIANPTPGTYYVQILTDTPGDTTTRHGSNSFALRANVGGGTWEPCSVDQGDPVHGRPGTLPAETCPVIFAVEHLGAYLMMPNAVTTFDLASISHDHQGKVLEIDLFDLGEGSNTLELLDPTGNPVAFDWRVLCYDGSDPVGGVCPGGGDTAPTGGWASITPTTSLDLMGNQAQCTDSSACSYPPVWVPWNPQPGPYRTGTGKYNDRVVRLRTLLPSDFQSTYGDARLWRVRITTGDAPTDRTTWTARLRS
jgi:hypothetical protein